jgi:hypothetical protein
MPNNKGIVGELTHDRRTVGRVARRPGVAVLLNPIVFAICTSTFTRLYKNICNGM